MAKLQHIYTYIQKLKKKKKRISYSSTAVFSHGKLSEVSSQPVVLVVDNIQKICNVY